MQDPKALGMVLATIVDGAGKAVHDGAAKGHLYVSPEEISVVKPHPIADLADKVSIFLLLGSVIAVVVNLFTWKSAAVLWAAVAAQAIHWIGLPRRRRYMEPKPLTADELEAARRAHQVAIQVPARAILRLVAPEPPKTGFRKPARFELPDGALEIYLSADQFREVAAALGRDA
ncbi:MAG TPA: hypothetical protein VF841_14005 [Anaeromyxobacter sp.]